VYLGLAVVLASASRTACGLTGAGTRMVKELGITRQTLQRWQTWWSERFPLTPLWRASCARFMPAVDVAGLPASLLERFVGSPAEVLTRLLVFLSPVTLRGGRPGVVEAFEGR
jgi:membrane protein required for beta-lactamase induction